MSKIKKYLQALGQLTDVIETNSRICGHWIGSKYHPTQDEWNIALLDEREVGIPVPDHYVDPDEKEPSGLDQKGPFQARQSYIPLVHIAPANTKTAIYCQNNYLQDQSDAMH